MAKIINGKGAINGAINREGAINGEAGKKTNFIEIKSSNNLVKISTKRPEEIQR